MDQLKRFSLSGFCVACSQFFCIKASINKTTEQFIHFQLVLRPLKCAIKLATELKFGETYYKQKYEFYS